MDSEAPIFDILTEMNNSVRKRLPDGQSFHASPPFIPYSILTILKLSIPRSSTIFTAHCLCFPASNGKETVPR